MPVQDATQPPANPPDIPDSPAEPRRVKPSSKYRVRRITPDGSDPVQFAHEDKGVARKFVADNHPRGREVYVHHPDGYREHYSADQAFQGSDNGGWNELTDEDFE